MPVFSQCLLLGPSLAQDPLIGGDDACALAAKGAAKESSFLARDTGVCVEQTHYSGNSSNIRLSSKVARQPESIQQSKF